MATFIKAKLRKLDEQTNIDNYRLAVNITEYHIISNIDVLFMCYKNNCL